MVVAAGRGTRLGGGTPKQFRPIAGVPMLLRALRPFVSHPDVAHTVVVLPPDDAEAPPDWLRPLVGGTLSTAPGGAERGDSVAAGLARLPAACATVLVHDAARPFVDRDTIDQVIARARAGLGAVAAVPLGDTLKRADEDRSIRGTVSRTGLWRAQTPQGFPRALLEAAYAAARRDGYRGTDDAELVERCGGRVEVVPDRSWNLKVTTADDLLLAELLAARTP